MGNWDAWEDKAKVEIPIKKHSKKACMVVHAFDPLAEEAKVGRGISVR